MGKDVFIEIRRLEGASPAQGGYRLQSSASGPERAKGIQWIFHPRLRAGSDAYPARAPNSGAPHPTWKIDKE
jgi:hypothetical protein